MQYDSRYHNTESHMHGWPVARRMDPWAHPLIEIFCKHGVGHPMPESVAWIEKNEAKPGNAGTWSVHGCDGCCIPPHQVHNHGIDPSCKESMHNGQLTGECMHKKKDYGDYFREGSNLGGA